MVLRHQTRSKSASAHETSRAEDSTCNDERYGGSIFSALDNGSSGPLLCSWPRHFTLDQLIHDASLDPAV